MASLCHPVSPTHEELTECCPLGCHVQQTCGGWNLTTSCGPVIQPRWPGAGQVHLWVGVQAWACRARLKRLGGYKGSTRTGGNCHRQRNPDMGLPLSVSLCSQQRETLLLNLFWDLSFLKMQTVTFKRRASDALGTWQVSFLQRAPPHTPPAQDKAGRSQVRPGQPCLAPAPGYQAPLPNPAASGQRRPLKKGHPEWSPWGRSFGRCGVRAAC